MHNLQKSSKINLKYTQNSYNYKERGVPVVETKKRKGISITFKILGMSLTCLIIALTMAQTISTRIAIKQMVTKQKENLETLAVSKGISLEDYIDSQKVLTSSVTNNAVVIQACQEYMDKGTLNTQLQDSLAEYLGEIQHNSDNLYENFFVTAGTAGFADCQGNATLHDVGEEPFYIECMKNGYFFGNNISPVTGNPVYVIAYAIVDPVTGEKIGAVNNSIDLATMTAQMITDAHFDIKLFDHNGLVVASPDTESILSFNLAQADPAAWQVVTDKVQGYMDYMDPYSGEKGYTGFSYTDNFVCEVSVNDSTFDGIRNKLISSAVVSIILAALVSFIFISIVIMTIMKPIKKTNSTINAIIEGINAGHGDLTMRVDVKSRDEIGQIADRVNQFIETLQKVMSMLGNHTGQMNEISTNVGNSITETEDEIANVSSTMEEMSASGEETSAALTQITEQVNMVTQLVENVNEQAMNHSKSALSILQKVERMREDSLKQSKKNSEEADAIIAKLEESMKATKEVDKITELTDEILNIASQTNLLALNASIEAARAGEAGKGFAVVADEIRQLADNSRDTANNIQQISSGVIASVSDLSEKSNEIAKAFVESNTSNKENTENVTGLYQQDIENMAGAMDEFAENSRQIQNSMEAIKESIAGVNIALEENVNGITNVTNSTADLANSMANINKEAQLNLKISSEIQEEVMGFKF